MSTDTFSQPPTTPTKKEDRASHETPGKVPPRLAFTPEQIKVLMNGSLEGFACETLHTCCFLFVVVVVAQKWEFESLQEYDERVEQSKDYSLNQMKEDWYFGEVGSLAQSQSLSGKFLLQG